MNIIVTSTKKIKSALTSAKGKIVTVTTEKPYQFKKSYTGQVITERSTYQVQVGVAYDNKAVVIQGRENGNLPEENAGLSGMEWVEYPHIKRSLKTGKEYLAGYPVKSGVKNKKEYFLPDGTPVDIDSGVYAEHRLAPKKHYDGKVAVVSIGLDTIVSVKGI